MNRTKSWIWFCCLLLSVTTIKAGIKKSKSVSTLLEAKWAVTPLVLEVAEYLADENVEYYWDFIDSICNLDPPLSDISKLSSRNDACS